MEMKELNIFKRSFLLILQCPAPEYSPPRPGDGPSYNQPAPPYSGPSVSYYSASSPFDYSQYNPYTINQPDPSFYPMHPAGQMNSNSTTVVIQQPIAGLAPNGQRLWSSGVCDCCNDMKICEYLYIVMRCITSIRIMGPHNVITRVHKRQSENRTRRT